MCNDWFNIRFGIYHLQIGPDSGISWSKNPYWQAYKPHTWQWFAIYTFFGVHL